MIANSDLTFSRLLAKALRANGHYSAVTRTDEETLKAFKTTAPSVGLFDLTLLGLSGLDVLAHVKAAAPHLPVVVITGDVPPDVETRAREMDVADVLRKRLKIDVLMQAINSALRHAGRLDFWIGPKVGGWMRAPQESRTPVESCMIRLAPWVARLGLGLALLVLLAVALVRL